MYTRRRHGVFTGVFAATGVAHFKEEGGAGLLSLTREIRHSGVTRVADARHFRRSIIAAFVIVSDDQVT